MRKKFSVPTHFSLHMSQVPEPPTDSAWASMLRWIVMVMNHNDPQLHFAASCLAYALKNGGLTKKQHEACQRMYERVRAAYEADALDCQWFLTEEDFEYDQIATGLIDSARETKH